MKYFIISDVHGSPYYLDLAIERFKQFKADKIICLGDFYYHGPRNPLTKDYEPLKVNETFNNLKDILIAIKGNCDAEVDQMISVFEFKDNFSFMLDNGMSIYCHHGHKEVEEKEKYNLILSGHTHVGIIKKEDGVVYANPGSISLPKADKSQGFMILDEKSIQHYDLLDGSLINEFIF